tara:strand:- start:12215 stop:13246 length:1032 start_codon:yes stop_codon:yes gene_type:complete
MAMQQVEFEFPDAKDEQDNSGQEVELEVEGRASEQNVEVEVPEPKTKATVVEEDLEIEVVDDTPPADRNRKPSTPPEDVSEDELEHYSEKVRKRIQHFSKGYHDERRAREQALREKDEAIRVAQTLVAENTKLKGSVAQNQNSLVEQAKRASALELERAKSKYKAAYEAGDADALMDAQEALTSAKIRTEKLASYKPAPLQPPKNEVQQQQQPAPERVVDTKAVDWQDKNPWFGPDDEMTSFALGLHQKLVKDGVDPRSNDYYERINTRMRQVFKDYFEDGNEDDVVDKKPQKKANVVASATRSTAPKKIVLTHTQVAIAKRLGVPLRDYANQVAEEMRKQNV